MFKSLTPYHLSAQARLREPRLYERELLRVRPTVRDFDFLSDLLELFLADR